MVDASTWFMPTGTGEMNWISPRSRRSVDLGHSAYDRLRIPRDGDQRSELMSITIPKRVRVLDGVTDPLGGSRKNLLQLAPQSGFELKLYRL